MSNFSEKMKGAGAKALVVLKDKAPEIGVVAGCVGVVGGTVLACFATRKLDDILKEHREEMEKIKSLDELDKKELRRLYVRTSLRIAKIYALPFAVEFLSLASILAGHGARYKRYAMLSSEVASLVAYNKEIRKRLEDKFGEEGANDILYGTTEKEVEETVIDEKTGKEKKVKKTIKVVDKNLTSPYAFYYDERFPGYRYNDTHYNLTVLSAKEAFLTTLLNARGVLSFSDEIEELGANKEEFFTTVEDLHKGQNTGHRLGQGDDQVLFRPRLVKRERDGEIEDAILCDPNIDGWITK